MALKFKAGEVVRISGYRSSFFKVYTYNQAHRGYILFRYNPKTQCCSGEGVLNRTKYIRRIDPSEFRTIALKSMTAKRLEKAVDELT
jgi:hypothetical protein